MDSSLLLSIQVGRPRSIGSDDADDAHDQQWFSAFFKEPVNGPVRVGKLTIDGDGQADLRVHGGEDRPILAYCAEHYPRWEAELHGIEMPFGGFGENFTITGMDEQTVCLGDVYTLGPVKVEVSQPRQPCWKLARRWRNNQLPALVIKHNRGGWYFRVLEEGIAKAGMPFERLSCPHPQWTIAAANHVMYHGQNDAEATAALVAVPALSEQWKSGLSRRLGEF